MMLKGALAEARMGAAAGEPPFGAVIFDQSGRVVARAHDTVRSKHDMTRHAETDAVRLAVCMAGADLSGCTLVTTVEPCPMCFTAAWLSKITCIVYGTTMTAVAQVTGGGQREVNVPVEKMNEMSGGEVRVVGGVLAEECLGMFCGKGVEGSAA
jgi:tRNA(adenine34) deaminase